MNEDVYPFEVDWADDAVVMKVGDEIYTLTSDDANALAADLQEMAKRTKHGLDHDEE